MQKSKFRVSKYAALSLGLVAIFIFSGCESFQKDMYDKKADAVGTKRTVYIYNYYSDKPLKVFSDSKMRFDRNPDGSVSFWLGAQNKKITTNGLYIVEDDK